MNAQMTSRVLWLAIAALTWALSPAKQANAQAEPLFLFEFGSLCDGAFQFPQDVAVDGSDRIVVADTDHARIQVFDAEGNFLLTFGSQGSRDGEFARGFFGGPTGVATDSAGRIIVADENNNRVQVFDPSGNFLFKFGSEGTGDGELQTGRSKVGVTSDGDDRIIVTDRGNFRIQVFDSSGNFLFKFGAEGEGDGQFQSPSDVATDSTGRIIVLEFERVQVFDRAGNFLSTFNLEGGGAGERGSGAGHFGGYGGVTVDGTGRIIVSQCCTSVRVFDPDGEFLFSFEGGGGGVATDSTGRIIVADTGSGLIQLFDGSGSFLADLGSEALCDGQFGIRGPAIMATDRTGRIIVAEERNPQIQVFDPSGNFLFKFGSEGSGDGEFGSDFFEGPTGLATDGAGRIVVADPGNNRIQVFDDAGSFLFKLGAAGIRDGQFLTPIGVAADSAGRIFVSDSGNARIQVFDSSGNFLFKFGSEGTGDGQFGNPGPMAIDSSGRIVIADYDSRVHVFDASGNFLFKFGSEGTGDGQFGSQRFFGQGAEGVAVDGAGRIVVADADNHRVQVFDAAGNFLYKFGAEGTGVGQFRYPRGVAADSAGRIVVADSGNIRIQVLAPDCNGNGVPDPEEVASGIGDPCSPSFIRGDCDGDGDACSGVNDALTMLSWLFRGDTRPPCIAACDSNGDGETELTDAVFGLDFCFKGTAPPPAPFPECGPGTETDANLGCATSPKPCQLGGQP